MAIPTALPPLTEELRALNLGLLTNPNPVDIGAPGISTLQKALEALYPETKKKLFLMAALGRATEQGFNVNFVKKGDRIWLTDGALWISEISGVSFAVPLIEKFQLSTKDKKEGWEIFDCHNASRRSI